MVTSIIVPQARLRWDFNDFTESMTGDPRYNMIIRDDKNGATNTPTISNGILKCDGHNDFLQMAQNIDFTLTSYSMEVKVRLGSSLANNHGAGTISTVGEYYSDGNYAGIGASGSTYFNSIVFDEKDDLKWFAGSEWLNRTFIDNGYVENSTDWIHMIVTYDVDNQLVTLYRNGEQYGVSYKPGKSKLFDERFLIINSTQFESTNQGYRIVFCTRHVYINEWLDGEIDFGAIYDYALTSDEVNVLYRSEFENGFLCQQIYDGGWSLVRHSYNSWHQATDNLNGTDTYGEYENNPKSNKSWSIQFDKQLNSDGSTLFMFSNGGCSQYIITKNNQFKYDTNISHIIASHLGSDYYAEWYNRGASYPMDPLIISNITNGIILYAEDNTISIPTREYVNVFIS